MHHFLRHHFGRRTITVALAVISVIPAAVQPAEIQWWHAMGMTEEDNHG